MRPVRIELGVHLATGSEVVEEEDSVETDAFFTAELCMRFKQ